jgi:hypothetical protein
VAWFGVLCGVLCGCCAGAVSSAKVWCLVPVRVYPSKDKMAWFGAVPSAMVGCKVKVQRFGAVVGAMC